MMISMLGKYSNDGQRLNVDCQSQNVFIRPPKKYAHTFMETFAGNHADHVSVGPVARPPGHETRRCVLFCDPSCGTADLRADFSPVLLCQATLLGGAPRHLSQASTFRCACVKRSKTDAMLLDFFLRAMFNITSKCKVYELFIIGVIIHVISQ